MVMSQGPRVGRSPHREDWLAGSRLGVTVSRRVGHAVVRNRVKRHVREWYRTTGRHGLEGMDLVVVARASARALPGSQIRVQLDELLGEALTRYAR